MSKRKKLLQFIANPLDIARTKKVLHVNPTLEKERVHTNSTLSLYNYDANKCEVHDSIDVAQLPNLLRENTFTWLNVDVVTADILDKIQQHIFIHPLLLEDIAIDNQRPKLDEVDNQIFCVLQMMYFNDLDKSVESEQVSLVLGKEFLISFQADPHRDHFDAARNKLKITASKHRTKGVDFLLYSLLDAIVDNYYLVMDKLGTEIEALEENIAQGETTDYTMSKINNLRKEMIMFRRNVVPVRDILTQLYNTESPLLDPANKRYFKDVQDHILQAIDLSENHRDILNSIRDLYVNQVNLKSNEVMKFLAIITSLLAPATVLGGIFGMNFDKLPWQHNQYGFLFVALLMIGIPIVMLAWFRRQGWF
ncbi:MAG: magnesium/cobalt transporter CorA [Bacteroidota bacterium]|jgi:magnesium transporter